MKQPVAANVIEFPSSIMAKTSNILAAFVVAFLASLSLSSAFTEHNLDISDIFERHLDHELQPLLREKREKEAEVFQLRNDNSLELEEELSEPKSINERNAIGEEAKDGEKNEKSEKPITESKRSIEEKEAAEEDDQDDVFSYRTMHDLIKTLIEADEDITEKLQQLRQAENATESEKPSNLLKRQATASAAAAASSSSSLLGANPWDAIPLDDLDAHSCESEAFSHGHSHVSGTLVHEFGCELRKSWHYGRLVLRNLNSGLSLGPLIPGGEIVSDSIFNQFCHRTSHLLHAVIREPHHLLILPDIIRDAIPCPSIIGAFHRLKHVFFRVLHFGLDLCRGHGRHVFGHLFGHSHRHHLKEKLHHHLHHLHHSQKCGSILPPLEEIVAEPIVSTVTSAAAAATTATATAVASSDSSVVDPDYHTSLAEVLSSFRGFYDGYYASGIPHLIGTSTSGTSVSSAFSRIGSYFSGLPFFSQFGCGPVEQSTTVTTASAASASSSVGIGGGPVISPVIQPTIVPAPIIPIQAEPVSSSASATATATTTVAETQPVFSAGPTIVPSAIPYESSFAGETATAAAAATATAAAASPVVSGYPTASLIPPVPTLSPAFVPVGVPEVVPNILEDNVVATSAAAVSDVVSTPIFGRVPRIRPLHKHKARPVLFTGAPAAAAAAAAASASASTGDHTLYGPEQYRGLDLDIDRRIRYPLNRLPVGIPPSAASSAAAASTATASAAASSSASSVSSGGFNFALPRQHIVDALGYDYLQPGDIVTVTLRNKSTLFGRILDATSPVTFDFLRPKTRASLLRHGGRLWNLLPRDFRDPECYRKFNDPLLLRHGL